MADIGRSFFLLIFLIAIIVIPFLVRNSNYWKVGKKFKPNWGRLATELGLNFDSVVKKITGRYREKDISLYADERSTLGLDSTPMRGADYTVIDISPVSNHGDIRLHIYSKDFFAKIGKN